MFYLLEQPVFADNLVSSILAVSFIIIAGTWQMFGPCLLWPNGWMDQDTT